MNMEIASFLCDSLLLSLICLHWLPKLTAPPPPTPNWIFPLTQCNFALPQWVISSPSPTLEKLPPHPQRNSLPTLRETPSPPLEKLPHHPQRNSSLLHSLPLFQSVSSLPSSQWIYIFSYLPAPPSLSQPPFCEPPSPPLFRISVSSPPPPSSTN